MREKPSSLARSITMEPLSELPDDLLQRVFSHLDVQALLRCEGTSKHMQSAVADDVVWQPRCLQHWSSANLGRLTQTQRACFVSANGWAHLPALPRVVEDVSPSDGRRRAPRVPNGQILPDDSISAFDTTEHALIWSSRKRVCFRRTGHADRIATWPTDDMKPVDVKLIPSTAGESPRALGLFTHHHFKDTISWLRFDEMPEGDADAVYHAPKLHPIVRFDTTGAQPTELLPANDDPSSVLVVGKCMAGPTDAPWQGGWVWQWDLEYAALVLGLQVGFGELRSACNGPIDSPHEVILATKDGGKSYLIHRDLRCDSHSSAMYARTGHANVRRVRRGAEGTHTVLTSHTRSKAVEVWDVRKFGVSRDAAEWQSSEGALVDSFKCAGNCPDFSCAADGTIAAVCGGAPGTTYGAKLHIFSACPRRLAAEATLSEIIVDDAHRLVCPLGIRFSGRSLSLIADKRRLLHCHVPGV